MDSYGFHVQIVDLMRSKEGSQGGVAFFISLYSLLREKRVQAALVVLGEMTIQGNVLPVRSLVEPLQVIMDNGAKPCLIFSCSAWCMVVGRSKVLPRSTLEEYQNCR